MNQETVIAQVINDLLLQHKTPTLPNIQLWLYHVKVWSLVGRHPIINTPFFRRKWGGVQSPVVESIYYDCVSSVVKPIQDGELSSVQKSILDFVLEHYTNFSRLTLLESTCFASPWKQTPMNDVVLDELVLNHYCNEPFAQNIHKLVSGLPIEPYFKLRTNGHYAFVMDMSEDDAQRVLTYESYESYKERTLHAKHESDLFFKKLFAEINNDVTVI